MIKDHLIIGFGEVGKAIAEIFPDAYIISDIISKEHSLNFKVMHICFPYNEEFISNVKNYIQTYKPEHIIIYSTVPIGTTKQIKGAVHSPIEGRHPDLELSIRQSVRWIGCDDLEECNFFGNIFFELGIKTCRTSSSNFTEFLKLRSTAKYGINLAWTDYEKRVADALGMDFELLKDFDKDYNRLYKELGEDWAQRYILDPPEGKIGGHCVADNAKLLNEQYPDKRLQEIIDMGQA